MTARTNKMPSITKDHLAAAIFENVTQAGKAITKPQAKLFVDEFFIVLKARFAQDHKVALRGYGVLAPRVKKGGRPVRNPKTREELPMHDTVTVMLNGKTETAGRTNTSDIIDVLAAGMTPRSVAEIAVSTIIEHINMTKDGSHRMEIRYFGVFHSHWRDAKQGRNPKTGAPVMVPGRYAPMFKTSRKLREHLVEAYGL